MNDVADFLLNPDLLKGTTLQILTIVGLTGLVGKWITDSVQRDRFLPLAAVGASLIVIVLPAYITDPRMELFFRAIVLGCGTTGVYGVGKDWFEKILAAWRTPKTIVTQNVAPEAASVKDTGNIDVNQPKL